MIYKLVRYMPPKIVHIVANDVKNVTNNLLSTRHEEKSSYTQNKSPIRHEPAPGLEQANCTKFAKFI